jgi:hypothetical protein
MAYCNKAAIMLSPAFREAMDRLHALKFAFEFDADRL